MNIEDNTNNDRKPFVRMHKDDSEDFTHYRHEIKIIELDQRTCKMEIFVNRAELPIEYIESIIKRNNERADAIKKITENIIGWGIMGFMTWIGVLVTTIVWPALITKLKQYISGF